MTFGSPAKIPGFPSFVLAKVKRMGWCLCDGSGPTEPVFIGSDCWFRTKRDLIAALEPVRATHVPAQNGCVVRMSPRSQFVAASA